MAASQSAFATSSGSAAGGHSLRRARPCGWPIRSNVPCQTALTLATASAARMRSDRSSDSVLSGLRLPSHLGAGFGDRFEVSRVGSGFFEERVRLAGEIADCRESTVAAQFLPHAAAARILHGKEGVDGSSPSEGLRQKPCKWGCSVACGGIPSASRVRDGYTFGHWRAFADTRDLWRRLARRSVPAMELRDPRISLHAGTIRCGVGQEHEPLPPERVSRPGRCRFRAGQALDRYSRPARVALRRGSAAAVAVNG